MIYSRSNIDLISCQFIIDSSSKILTGNVSITYPLGCNPPVFSNQGQIMKLGDQFTQALIYFPTPLQLQGIVNHDSLFIIAEGNSVVNFSATAINSNINTCWHNTKSIFKR